MAELKFDIAEMAEVFAKAAKERGLFVGKWIPITSRPMTEEEKERYKTHQEYQDDCRIFNCKLPDDGQEVLISVCGGVEVDTFVQDANDGCYFEGRDIDDVDAWMPLPLPAAWRRKRR